MSQLQRTSGSRREIRLWEPPRGTEDDLRTRSPLTWLYAEALKKKAAKPQSPSAAPDPDDSGYTPASPRRKLLKRKVPAKKGNYTKCNICEHGTNFWLQRDRETGADSSQLLKIKAVLSHHPPLSKKIQIKAKRRKKAWKAPKKTRAKQRHKEGLGLLKHPLLRSPLLEPAQIK